MGLGLRKEEQQHTTQSPPQSRSYNTYMVAIMKEEQLLQRFIVVAPSLNEALTKLTAYVHGNPMSGSADSVAIEEIMSI